MTSWGIERYTVLEYAQMRWIFSEARRDWAALSHLLAKLIRKQQSWVSAVSCNAGPMIFVPIANAQEKLHGVLFWGGILRTSFS